MNKLRMIFAYPLSLIAYCIGFVVGGFLGELMNFLAIILPPMVDRASIGLSSSALGANALGYICFIAVYPLSKSKSKATKSFCVILFLIALAYGISCFIYGTTNLLWYSGLSIILSVITFFTIDNEYEKELEDTNQLR
jgi:hypothetical protein